MQVITIRIEESARFAVSLMKEGITFEAYQIDAVHVKFELLGY